MSRVSEENREKIKESMLREFYDYYPGMLWTSQVAERIVRDEEFSLRLLKELNEKGLVLMREESRGGKVKRKWGINKEVWEKNKELV